MKALLSFAISVLFLSSSDAAVLIDRGFLVFDSSGNALKELSSKDIGIIDHVKRDSFEVFGGDALIRFLENSDYVFGELADAPAFLADAYPTPEQTIETMQALSRNCRGMLSLETIGNSVQGRPLVFARITSNRGSNKPEFKYIANMHGDEITGREFMIWLLQDLCAGYGADSRITQLLDSVDIYIMPSMNPDGAALRRRSNAARADLNRSFPDFTTADSADVVTDRPPEVQAVMNFEARHRFKLSANFHGGAEVVNYPWDTKADPFPRLDLVKGFSLEYSKRVPYLIHSTSFRDGITNGYAWYQVNGGMQDWSFYYRNDLQITIELTEDKWPPYDSLRAVYAQNKDALIHYIESTLEF